MTIKTIEDTLGVRIDRYIMIHDNAVKAIVEALGGVDVYVENLCVITIIQENCTLI